MQNEEIWLPAIGFEGRYEVSNLGRVRSVDRIEEYCRESVVIKRRHRGRILSPCSSAGYPSVNLGRKQTKVHRLVCKTFHGMPAPGQEVLHKDGTRSNPRADNLRWGSHAENVEDMFLHGVRTRKAPKAKRPHAGGGERQHLAVLTDEKVREMRRLSQGGENAASIAKQFGVNHKTAWRAVVRRTWKHIE